MLGLRKSTNLASLQFQRNYYTILEIVILSWPQTVQFSILNENVCIGWCYLRFNIYLKRVHTVGTLKARVTFSLWDVNCFWINLLQYLCKSAFTLHVRKDRGFLEELGIFNRPQKQRLSIQISKIARNSCEIKEITSSLM